MAQNVIEILQNCRLFKKLSPEAFQCLAVMARLKHFRKGQNIFRENDPCPGVYIVGSGSVRVFKTGTGGKEHVLHLVSPGNTFAEAAAIGGFDLPASAAAVSKTSCVLLPLAPFRQALDQFPPLGQGMMLGLTLWLRQLVSLMEDLVLRNAAGRLARFLLDARQGEEIIIKLPSLKRHVASHLNLTSETFSRTLRRLLDAGLIVQLKGNRWELRDLKALQSVADGLFPRL